MPRPPSRRGAGADLHELVEDALSVGRARCQCRCRPRRCAPSRRDGGRRARRRPVACSEARWRRDCAGSARAAPGRTRRSHAVGTTRSASPHAAACAAKSPRSRANSGPERDFAALRLQCARVEPGQVEELPEQCFQRLDGGLDARGPAASSPDRAFAPTARRRRGPSRAAAGEDHGSPRQGTGSSRGWRSPRRRAPISAARDCAVSSPMRSTFS